MRQALKIGLLFLVALFASDRLIAFGLKHAVDHSQDRFVRMYTGRARADILILGNSRADRHFPPRRLEALLPGKRVVNLGLGGISTTLSEALLLDFIERNGPPKTLVLALGGLNVDPASVGDMRLFGVYSNRIRAVTRHHDPKLYVAGTLFRLFRFNNEMFLRVLLGIVKEEKDRTLKAPIPSRLVERLRRRTPDPVHAFPENLESLRHIIDCCDRNGIVFVPVITPVLEVNTPPNFGEWRREVGRTIGGRAAIRDYSTLVSDPALFHDASHLNADGVDVLLARMIRDGTFGR